MEGMREVLRAALGKGLAGLTPLDRLAAAWPVACGRALAGRGEVTALEDGVLTIRTEDRVWLGEMVGMRAQLTAELRRIAAVDLREIHFEAGPARPQRPGGATAGAAPMRPPARRRSERSR